MPRKKATEPSPPARQRLAVVISSEVVERAKNAVYWTPGLTLASLTEEALAKALDKLERRNGGPFEPRRGELTPGRPVR